jgi:hypothetical protein
MSREYERLTEDRRLQAIAEAVAHKLNDAEVHAVAKVLMGGSYIVLWRRLMQGVEGIEWGVHRAVEMEDGRIDLSSGDYFPAPLEHAEDARLAARRSFAARAGFREEES